MRKENTCMLNSLVIVVHNKFFHELSQNTSYSTDNKWELKLSKDNSLGSTAFVNEEHLCLHRTSGWICFPKFGESIHSFHISVLAKFSTTCTGSGIIIFQFLSTIVSIAIGIWKSHSECCGNALQEVERGLQSDSTIPFILPSIHSCYRNLEKYMYFRHSDTHTPQQRTLYHNIPFR